MKLQHLPKSEAQSSVCDGVWARAALVAIVIWPTFTGFLVLQFDFSPGALQILGPLSVALLLYVAGALADRGAPMRVMAKWQLALTMALALAFVVSTARSALQPSDALIHGLIDATLAAGAIGAFLLLRAGGEVMIRRMLLSIVLAGLVYIIFYVLNFDRMVAMAEGQNATVSFFPYVNVRRLTNALAPAVAIAIVLWTVFGPRGRWLGYFYGLVATILVTFLMWSGGRAPVGASLLALLGLSIWAKGELRRRLIGRVAVAYTAGTGLSVLLPIPESGSLGFWSRIFAEEKTASLNVFSSNRLGIWESTLQMIPDRLWFGHGYWQWQSHRDEFALHGSAHNFPLQILFDFGLIGGGAAIILAFGTWLRHIRMLDDRRPLHIAAVAGLSVMMIQCFLDGIFSGRPSLLMVLLAFSIASAALHAPKNTQI